MVLNHEPPFLRRTHFQSFGHLDHALVRWLCDWVHPLLCGSHDATMTTIRQTTQKPETSQRLLSLRKRVRGGSAPCSHDWHELGMPAGPTRAQLSLRVGVGGGGPEVKPGRSSTPSQSDRSPALRTASRHGGTWLGQNHAPRKVTLRFWVEPGPRRSCSLAKMIWRLRSVDMLAPTPFPLSSALAVESQRGFLAARTGHACSGNPPPGVCAADATTSSTATRTGMD